MQSSEPTSTSKSLPKPVKKIKRTVTTRSFRLFDFHVFDQRCEDETSASSDDAASVDPVATKRETPSFVIQMFGLNERGETCALFVTDYAPFFYVRVGDSWTKRDVAALLDHLKQKVGAYHGPSILSAELVEHHKLYGFTGGKTHQFAKLTFKNMAALNRTKNLWYAYGKDKERDGDAEQNARRLQPLVFKHVTLQLYESTIPPLLRYFHIHEISPSGWVSVNVSSSSSARAVRDKTTTCTFEYMCKLKSIVPLPEKETRVPYKICSFDIEASSSHGDFPLPVKTYKRLATNMVDVFRQMTAVSNQPLDQERAKRLLQRVILTGFGLDTFDNVDLVYPKVVPTREQVAKHILVLQNHPIKHANLMNEVEDNSHLLEIDRIFDQIRDLTDSGGGEGGGGEGGEDEDGSGSGSRSGSGGETHTFYKKSAKKQKVDVSATTLVDVLLSDAYERDVKIQIVNETLTRLLPRLRGDEVTFIGSTFLRYGEPEPYLNHCLVEVSCDAVDGATIQSVPTELDLLMQWRNLIQTENPDIIIGYNIFGFDYEFMFRRAQENGCERAFLQLSRKQGEICAKPLRKDALDANAFAGDDEDNTELAIENTKIVLATGEYDLRYFKMMGRLQIDMYTYFRRDFNLASYKLDDVAGQYISDDIKHIQCVDRADLGPVTELCSGNLTGLHVGDFIHIEISGFTSDYYKQGKKFRVLAIDKGREIAYVDAKGKSVTSKFNVISIGGHETDLTEGQAAASKHVKWAMAKDDVTPQDIFRLAKGSAADRAVVAKYCIQDCNLVHHLMGKIDVLTGYVEMSRICSVPISFLVFRGQGIKLTSYVAKKCREKNTLMPDLEKTGSSDGYEGAIVLSPKCSMYMDNPVACVDYASLYPSSMISQNYSHDSKVWTREYDLDGKLIRETGEKDGRGQFIYDNLPGYTYIDIEFDTYKSVRKTPTSRAEKVVCGKKVCRWAQLPHGQKSIMPAILEELLDARKKTRKQIKSEPDPFMQNILDKRQLGYKVTANSLYGQCGARTSTFFEQDVAASTTATGRQMITYAKRMIEEVYGDRVYETAVHGPVKCKAEYVYGDSVAFWTPVYVRLVVGPYAVYDICTIETLAKKYGDNQWTVSTDKGREGKEICELSYANGHVETWTERGWTRLFRVIRHHLAPHKKMLRIITSTGLVDVTDDHSLVLANGREISPKEVTIGTELLHYDAAQLYRYYGEERLVELEEQLAAAHEMGDLETMEFMHLRDAVQFQQSMRQRLDLGTTLGSWAVHSISQITYGKDDYVYDLTTANHHFAAGVGNLIVHNTDSVFFTFNLENPKTGEKIRGKPALEMTIEIAQDVAGLCTQFLKQPMELTYEKTLMPFILLSKKRYVGMLYETDANKGKLKYMGLSLKRRDSCDYLKDTYGGILNILMHKNDIQAAIQFLDQSLENLIAGTVPMEKLAITKALRSDYKNPMQIGHWVLAERIGKRDPGNKPKPGDRMKFVFIVNTDKKALMGDKIETPEYIVEHGLTIDYTHYITNQLMKPLQQLFGLALEPIWEHEKKQSAIRAYRRDMDKLETEYPDMETFMKKKEKYCSAKIKAILFDRILTKIEHRRTGAQTISAFFRPK